MNRRMEPTDETALDRVVTRWMHDEAPARAPDRLIDAVRVTASSTPQGSARGPMRIAVGALAVAAILVLAVLAASQIPGLLDDVGTQPSPSVSPSATPTATPSVSPTPATTAVPAGPDSLMSFTAPCDVAPPVLVPSTTILEDGRVIWLAEDGAFRVRRLSTAGLAQVRDEIDGTGLFEASATYDLVRRPGAPEPPGHGICTWEFAWSDGDAATIDVRSTNWLGDEEEAAYYEPAPERHALDDLARRLMDPEAWLSDDAWIETAAASFTPDHYVILVSLTDPRVATEGAPDVDTVSWPLETAPDASGECGVAEAAAVDRFAAELAQSGLEQFAGPVSGAGAILPWAAHGSAVDVSIWYQMPDGAPACDA